MSSASRRKRKAAEAAKPPESAPRSLRSRLRPWHFAVLLFVLGLTIYWPATQGPFVLDDFDLRESFSAVRSGHWRLMVGTGRPLLMATYVANHRLAGGFDPYPFHLTNVLLHCLNALLLWRFLAALFGAGRFGERIQAYRPLFVYGLPLLFLTSPIQTESVAYISSRSEVLATTFYLLGLWAFAALREKRPWLTALAVIVCFAGAALSKQDKLTLPFAILLLDYLLLSGLDWRGLKRSLPTYGVFGLGLVAGFFVVVRPFLYAPSAGFTLDWQPYLFTQFRMYFRYLGQLIYPFHLNLDPDIVVSESLGQQGAWLAMLLLIAIVAGAIYRHRHEPLPCFGALFFLVTLAPSSSFYPLLDFAAERRIYLPSIGFFLLLLWALTRWSKPDSKAPWAVVAGAVLLYSAGTYQRSVVWSDDLALWHDTALKSPQKERPITWAGRVAFNRGLSDLALQYWEKAEQVVEKGSDEHGYLLSNLGLIEARNKNYDAAIRRYRAALEIVDEDPVLWAQLAVAQMRNGQEEAGWQSFDKAFEFEYRMQAEVLMLRAQELYRTGQYERAVADYERALIFRPDDINVQQNLEIARRAAGGR